MGLRSLFFAAVAALTGAAHGQEPGPINDSQVMKAACANDVLAVRAMIRENPNCVQERDGDNRTALHYAAGHGALEVMQLLLANGAPVDAQSNEGLPPIMWTIDFRHLDAMKLLIKAGANLELKRHDQGEEVWPSGKNWGPREYTSLQCAIMGELPEEYMVTLLDAGANINPTSSGNLWTALAMVALKYRGTHLLKVFIDRGATVDARDRTGCTPLVVALQRGDAAQVRLLLDSGADPENVTNENDGWPGICRQTTMGTAAGNGSPDSVRVLAAFGAPINKENGEGQTPAEIAAKGHPDLTPLLTDMAAKQLAGWTPAHFAAEFGFPDAFPILKQRGVPIDQPDDSGQTPLMIAAAKGDADGCEALLKQGANIKRHDALGETALHQAAASGSVATVSVLLGYGESPDVVDTKGRTPQAIAAANNAQDALRLLANASKTSSLIAKEQGPEPADSKLKRAIESKQEAQAISILDANPNLASNRYAKFWTALHYAAYYGEAKLAAALLAKGAPIEAKTDTGWTPLMMAAQQGSAGVLKALLEAKADPNLQAKNGRTALHVAAQENRSACIDLLRKYGAKRNLKDGDGLTPLQIADQLGNTDAAKSLRS